VNVATAREFVRDHARNAGDPTVYTPGRIDRAVQAIADDLIWFTRCTRRVDDLALTLVGAGAAGALPTTFRPERVLRLWVPAKGSIDVVDHPTILDKQTTGDLTPGLPQMLAFTSSSTAEVWPPPNVDYTAKLLWVEPFTSWAPGDGSSDNTTLNLPDDYLRLPLMYGATSLLQHTDEEHKYGSESWAKYLAFRGMLAGAGSFSAQVATRAMAEV
jgi:hypothetical protein